jgi:hypothetical protein
MDAAKAYAEINELDQGFKQNDKEIIFKVMERCGASKEEIGKALAAIEEFGFSFKQMDRSSLKILLLQHLINDMRDGFIAESRSQSGEVLRQSREAHSEALADINAEIKKLSDEVLTNADHMFTKTRNQAVEVSKLIADLDPQGDLVGKFAHSVLQGVSEGIEAQANRFNEDMNNAISENVNLILMGNNTLEDKIALVSIEVQKIKDLNVPNLVFPLTHELKLQMKSITDVVDALVQKNREGLDAQSKDATEKLKSRNDETKKAYVDMTLSAKQKFGELITTAEGKFEEVIEKMEQAIEGKFWIERVKIWGGVAVIAVLASGLTNYLLFFRYFKY